MRKLQDTAKNLWENHRVATLLVGIGVGRRGRGPGGYLALKRPGDVSNEDAAFDAGDQQKGVVGSSTGLSTG